MRSLLKLTALISTINILFTVLGLYAYDRYFTREIVVFDVPAYVREARTEFLKGDITKEVLKERFEHLSSRLDELSTKKVILNKNAVIAGGRELSGGIQ